MGIFVMKHQHNSGLSQLFGLMAENVRAVGETTCIEGHTRPCHIVADHANERSVLYRNSYAIEQITITYMGLLYIQTEVAHLT